MRDYLRRQNRQAITGVEEVLTSVKPKELARYKGRFKLNTWSHKTKAKALNARREKGLALEAMPNKKKTTPEDDDADVELSRPKEEHQSPNPVFPLDRRRIDPFDSLAIRLGRRSEGLLIHCMLNTTILLLFHRAQLQALESVPIVASSVPAVMFPQWEPHSLTVEIQIIGHIL
jgi:hypothetical protein